MQTTSPKMPEVMFDFEGSSITFASVSEEDHLLRIMRRFRTFYELDVLCRLRDRLSAHGRTGVGIDAGGFIGTHSVFMAKCCGLARVLTFEANPATFPVLARNIAANVAGLVHATNAALGGHAGRGTVVPGPNGNSGMTRVEPSVDGPLRVTTIDAEVEKAPGDVAAIKIDVEGAELDVLDGATHVLEANRPVLCIEIHTVEHLRAVLERLPSYWIVDCLGYSPTYVLEPTDVPTQRRELVNEIWIERAMLPAGAGGARTTLRQLAQTAGAGRWEPPPLREVLS